MSRIFRVFLVMVLVSQFGCSAIQSPGWNKPWGRGAVIPAAVCTAIGAGTGVLIQVPRPGYSQVCSVDGCRRVEDDPEYWKGALIGGAIGAVVCGVLGHVFLDEAPAETAPAVPTGEGGGTSGSGIRVSKKIVLRGVNFDFDKSDIRPDSRPVLNEAAALLIERRADISMLTVEGHTDAVGTDAYNQALSLRRAEAVYRYLVNMGVPPEIMRVEGYGESHPVADNDTESGRAQNRRVELKVQPAAPGSAPAPAPTPAEPAEETEP